MIVTIMISAENSSALFSEDIEDILHLFKNRYLLREEVIQVDSRLKIKEMYQMPQNVICSRVSFFFFGRKTFLILTIHGVFNVSSHLKVENVCAGVEISFQSGLLNICCYSFFIIIVCCLQSSLRLYACVIKSINAFGKAVLQHPLEPFKVDSAFRSAFYYSVCILISLIILHTNHKASYILLYETF